MQNRIYVARNGNVITAFINGKNYKVECYSNEEVKVILALAIQAKNGDENALKELIKQFDPLYKIEVIGDLVRDHHGRMYLKDTNIPLNDLLVERICQHLEEGLPIDNLVNFWKLCLMNPNAEAREDLFRFLSYFNFPITTKGYFIGYKAVYYRGEKNRALVEYLSKAYLDWKISRKGAGNEQFIYKLDDSFYQMAKDGNVPIIDTILAYHNADEIEYYEQRKKEIAEDPVLYEHERVRFLKKLEEDYENNMYQPEDVEIICTIQTAMEKLSEILENDEADTFTDCYSRKMDICLGKPVTMDRKDCDSRRSTACSTGLHVGTPEYVTGFISGANRAIIACLVNPADVVAVPTDYSFQKMRTCEYFPYAVCKENEDGSFEEIEAKYFEEDYCGYELEKLNQRIKELECGTLSEGITFEEAMKLIQNRIVDLS